MELFSFSINPFSSNRSGSDRRIQLIERKLDLILDHLGIEVPELDYNDEILDALRDGDKIRAIKIYREHTGAGLREAKDHVESLQL